jgi:hypothetical protein
LTDDFDATQHGVQLESEGSRIQKALIPWCTVEAYSFADRAEGELGIDQLLVAIQQRARSDPGSLLFDGSVGMSDKDADKVFRAAIQAAMANATYKNGASATRTAPAQTVPVQTASARTASQETASEGMAGLEEAMEKGVIGSGSDSEEPTQGK